MGNPENAWAVATKYHELKESAAFKKRLGLQPWVKELVIEEIIRQAQGVLRSIRKRGTPILRPSNEWQEWLEQDRGDLETTVEESAAWISSAIELLEPSDLWLTTEEIPRQPIVIVIDTSLSMTGEKLALTAVALAVVLLQFPDEPIGVIAFENEAEVLLSPERKASLRETLGKFLDVPAQGYTHLERGIRRSLKLQERLHSLFRGQRPVRTALLTDGKYTAGRDPRYLSGHFESLNILKMGGDASSQAFCEDFAFKGNGGCWEVPSLKNLPFVMFQVVQEWIRSGTKSMKSLDSMP